MFAVCSRLASRHGSLFSGSEYGFSALEQLWLVLSDEFGLAPEETRPWLKHVFACENNLWKEQCISDHFPDIDHIFGAAEELLSEDHTAYCYIKEKKVPVPKVDLLVFGFSCWARSCQSM